ncbi:hypothetical protein [Nocardia nova]|uniref:hypothetical protein n=1 Tax=Nocardia nova TaxID=37330 RepID=UPI0033D83524
MPNSYLRDAARRRAARRPGGSFQKSLQALTRYDIPNAAVRNPPGLDWTALHGVEADFDNGTHQLRGVVLPPDGVRPGSDTLRVAVTSSHTGLAPAEVTYLDARRWTITPMPADVDRRHLPSRKRTRGPKGLPLYRFDDLPAAALATRTMLRTQYRARLAEGQAPIAEFYAGRDYYDLYAIDDSDPLATLPPAREAAWIRARTCARCGEQSPRRYTAGRDSSRYCGTCHPLAADDWWNTRLEDAQQAAIDWARRLVDDPDAILVNTTGATVTRLIVTQIRSGAILHDLTALRGNIDHIRQPWIPDDERRDAENALSGAELADHLAPLRHRRIIDWRGIGLRPIVNRLDDLLPAHVSSLDPWRPATDDDCGRWFAYWLHQSDFEPTGIRWTPTWDQPVTLRGRQVPTAGAPGWSAARDHLPTRAHADLALLHRMATGAPDSTYRPTPMPPGAPLPCTVAVYPHHLDTLSHRL